MKENVLWFLWTDWLWLYIPLSPIFLAAFTFLNDLSEHILACLFIFKEQEDCTFLLPVVTLSLSLFLKIVL